MNYPGDVITRVLQGQRAAPENRNRRYLVTCQDTQRGTGTFMVISRTREVFALQFQTSEIPVDPRNLAM